MYQPAATSHGYQRPSVMLFLGQPVYHTSRPSFQKKPRQSYKVVDVDPFFELAKLFPTRLLRLNPNGSALAWFASHHSSTLSFTTLQNFPAGALAFSSCTTLPRLSCSTCRKNVHHGQCCRSIMDAISVQEALGWMNYVTRSRIADKKGSVPNFETEDSGRVGSSENSYTG